MMDDMVINGEAIQAVGDVKYLGSIITQDGRYTKEIINRINMTKRGSLALYGYESRTIGKAKQKN